MTQFNWSTQTVVCNKCLNERGLIGGGPVYVPRKCDLCGSERTGIWSLAYAQQMKKWAESSEKSKVMVMTTTVVNIHRQESYDVYIGNPGKGNDGYWGNPFALWMYSGKVDRNECLRMYRWYFNFRVKTDPQFRKRLEGLRGKRLGCFCSPAACHGDIIVEYLEGKG